MVVMQFDIAFPVNMLACQMVKPNWYHWNVGMHLLRYLCNTCDFKLVYGKEQGARHEGLVTIYSDSNWAGDLAT